MRILFCCFLLVFTFSVSGQIYLYKKDSLLITRTVIRIVDSTDKEKLKILEHEILPLLEATIGNIEDQLQSTLLFKDSLLIVEVKSIADKLLENLEGQGGFLTKNVSIAGSLFDGLAYLKTIEEKKRYKRERKRLDIKGKLKEYRRNYNKLSNKRTSLAEEFFEITHKMIRRTVDPISLTDQFINTFSNTLKGIEEVKLTKALDSLRESNKLLQDIIQYNQDTIQNLEKGKEVLISELDNKEKEFKNESNNLKIISKEKDNLSLLIEKQQEESTELMVYINSLESEIGLINDSIRQMEEVKSRLDTSMILTQEEFCDLNNRLNTTKNALDDTIKERDDTEKILNDTKKILDNTKSILIDLLGKLEFIKLIVFLGLLAFSLAIGWGYNYNKRRKLFLANTQLEQAKKEREKTAAALRLSHKELQHRTKNNLQKINNLIYLRSSSIKDEQSKEVFESLQDQLDTFALIHQLLYTNENQKLTTINIADYAEKLIQKLVGLSVEKDLSIEYIDIEMDNAVEIGQLLHELVTNAHKYGFSNPTPKITVHIRQHNGFIHLMVKDNGVGFPSNFSIASSSNFGLMAINDLVSRHKQKGASIKTYSDHGAIIEIKLPFDEKSNRLIG